MSKGHRSFGFSSGWFCLGYKLENISRERFHGPVSPDKVGFVCWVKTEIISDWLLLHLEWDQGFCCSGLVGEQALAIPADTVL